MTPRDKLPNIRLQPKTIYIATRQIEASSCIPLLCRLTIQLNGSNRILRNTLSHFQTIPQIALSNSIPGISSELQ